MILLIILLAWQVSPELAQHVNAGLKAKEAKDWKTAITEFRRVAELVPALPAAHVNLGAVYFEAKEYGPATESLRKALALNPNLPGAEAMLGAALLAQGYNTEAIPHLEKGQAEDLLGVALLEGGREREAIDKLESALLKRPTDTDLHYYLSQAHSQLARKLAERLVKQVPDTARSRQLLGEAQMAAGNREAAVRELLAALEQRPDLRGVHLALGELYLGSGDLDAAEREFALEAKAVPGSASAAYRWGSTLLQKGEVPGALRELQRADRLRPEMPETLLELGRARFAAEEYAAAEAALRKVLAIEGQSKLAESAHFQLAQLYRKQKRVEEAEQEMRAFRKLRNVAGGKPD